MNLKQSILNWSLVSPQRRALDQVLIPVLKTINAKSVADVGGGGEENYNFLFPKADYKIIDIQKTPRVDIVADIQNMKNVQNLSFDLVIAVRLWLLLKYPDKAISEIKRILKNGGKAVVYLEFINYTYLAKPDIDWSRFPLTKAESYGKLFKGWKVYPIGNHHLFYFNWLWHEVMGFLTRRNWVGKRVKIKALFFVPILFLMHLLAKMGKTNDLTPIGWLLVVGK